MASLDKVYLAAFVAAFVTSVASAPLWRHWCQRHGMVDDPGQRKIHSHPIPLAGGLAVMTGLLIPLILGISVALAHPGTRDLLTSASAKLFDSSAMGLFEYGISKRGVQLAGIIFGAFGMLWLGMRDDLVELRPATKFAGQFLVALIVAAAGVRITLFIPNLLFSYGITALWILTVVNAFNFMDNMNGLCGGLGMIAAMSFALISAASGQYLVASTAFLVAGAVAGFLPYNFPRASIFLGDGGSHLIGYLLAVMGILPHFYSVKHPKWIAVLTPLLVLMVPLGDMAWVVLLRWRMGKPFYVGDTNHFSHRLVRRGLSKTAAVGLILLLSFLAGALAFLSQ